MQRAGGSRPLHRKNDYLGKAAASAKLPTRADGFSDAQLSSFDRSRVPTITECPCLRKPAASTLATSPRSKNSNFHGEDNRRSIF